MLQLYYDKNSGQTLANHRLEDYNFIKKETLVQGFSCEFCQIYKNTFYYRTPLVAASGVLINFAILELFSNKVAMTNILVLTKTFWRLLEDVFWRRKAEANIFVLIKTFWRRLEDVFRRRRQKTYLRRLQDVSIKTNVCWDSSLEPPVEYNQDQMPLTKQDSFWPFQPSWGLQKSYAVST